jgi:L-alanine-DL-glutamate epimerase-like enolase superfamily enzyme
MSFRDYIIARAIHFVQPDVAWAGGLTEGLKIAHLAQAWNLPLAPHIHGSVVAVGAALHILGSIPNGSLAEMVFPAHPLMADLAREPFLVDSAGHIEPGERPGLGVELAPPIVAKYRLGR